MSLLARNDSSHQQFQTPTQYQPYNPHHHSPVQPHNFSRPHPPPSPSSSASSGLNVNVSTASGGGTPAYDSVSQRHKPADGHANSLGSGGFSPHALSSMPPGSTTPPEGNDVYPHPSAMPVLNSTATGTNDSYFPPTVNGSTVQPGPTPPANGDAMAPYAAGKKPNAPASQFGRVVSSPAATGSTPGAQSLAPPPQGQLRQRHTLQVPKTQGSRASTPSAGSDAVTSGRFSPTSAPPRRGSVTLGRKPTRSLNSENHLDEVPPDEDAERWTEAIKARRATKKRKEEEDEEDKVLVGTKVDKDHANWVTAYNMLTGIRFCVSRVHAKMDRPLTDEDFSAKHKFSFDITGNELTPSAKYDFKFKDYSPWVFRHLRIKFGIDPGDYLMSLTSKYILSELGSPGKSGSFFYFSRDYKYIIKTIHHGEHKFLRHILREYYQHVEENPNTLISQFYGLHRVKTPYGRKIHFVVMNNLFPPHRDIHQTYDLKGSTIGRDYKEENLAENPRATLKDLNWLRREKHLEFGPEKKAAFVAQVERDVELLKKLEIMDYSLLVGIHDLSRGNKDNIRNNALKVFQPGGPEGEDIQGHALQRTPSKMEKARQARELRKKINNQVPISLDRSANQLPEEFLEQKNAVFYGEEGGIRATHETDDPADTIYYLGIIDCLTHYGFVKRMEHFWRSISNPKDRISAIPPSQYGDRFYKFITGLVKSPEEAARDKERKKQAEAADEAALGAQNQDGGNDVLEMALRDAAKSPEVDRPTRSIGTIRSPSAERTGGAQGAILPVVEETGEGSSSGAGRRSRNGSSASVSDSGRGCSFTEGGIPERHDTQEREYDQADSGHNPTSVVPISFSTKPTITSKHHSEDMDIRVAHVHS